MKPDDPGSAGDAGGRASRTPARILPRTAALRRAVARRVAIDPRALAALRVALGALLLADLATRSRDLVAFYTDDGVLPRAALHEQFSGFAGLSVFHGLSGEAWVQALLFLIAAGFAVMLLLGYRTRLATAACFVLLVSLHARNPVVLNAGDSVLRRLLFWSLFLPLSGRWSVDARRGRRLDEPVASVATAALLLQVVIVYTMNGAFKLRGDLWPSGEAVRYIFSLDQLTILLGDTLAEMPLLLEVFTRLWMAMVLASVLLLVLTGWRRAAFAALFAAMHVGMFLTMRLGLFPLISVAALLPFLQTPVWDAASGRLPPAVRRAIEASRWPARIDRVLPRIAVPRPPPALSTWTGRLASALVATLLVSILVWNAATLGYVDAPDVVTSSVDPSDRRWDMFAPNPRGDDGWFVVPGELSSGLEVDAFHGGPPDWDRPPELARTYPSHRWFVYMVSLPHSGSEPLREPFGAYLCRQWSQNHDEDLAALEIYYVEQRTRLGEAEPIRRVGLGRYTCPSG